MLSLKVIFALWLVAAVLGIEEKRAPILTTSHAPPYDPSMNATALLYDKNINTWFGTIFRAEAYVNSDYNWPVNTDAVEIVNRQDCCQSRLTNFWVWISQNPFPSVDQSPGSFNVREYTYGAFVTSAQNIYTVPFTHYPSIFSRVQLPAYEYFHVAEINLVEYPKISPLTAIISSDYTQGNFPASRLIDGNQTTFAHSDREVGTNPWVELTFRSQKVCKVVVFNRADCCTDRMKDQTVILKNSAFTSRPASSTLALDYCNNESGTICQHTYNTEQRAYTYNFPDEPVADRVRFFQHYGEYMNVGEVLVYGCTFSQLL